MSHFTEIRLMRGAVIRVDMRKLIGTFCNYAKAYRICDFMIFYTKNFLLNLIR